MHSTAMLRRIALVLAALAPARFAIASTDEDLAKALQQAWRGNDSAYVHGVATSPDGDIWLLVNELLALGDPATARALVEHVPDPRVRQALATYLSMPFSTPSREGLECLRRARAERLHGAAGSALDTLGRVRACPNVLGVLIEEERGRAHEELEDPFKSAKHILAAAEYASAIGWDARRNYLLRRLVSSTERARLRSCINDALLVGFERSLRSKECVVAYAFVQHRLVAAVVEAGSRPRFVLLGDSTRITEACSSLAKARGTGADEVHKLLLAPLDLRVDTQRLIIVPTEQLGAVPFAALEPQWEVVYAPVSVPLCETSGSGEGVLAVTDGEPEHTGFSTPTARFDTSQGEDLGAKCTHRWRAIHLECRYDPAKESVGALHMSTLLDLDVHADLLVFATSYSARVRLCDAYRIWPSPVGDGSALPCETLDRLIEVSKQRRRLGKQSPLYVLGIRRPQVLVHLWDLDEDSGRALMRRFYQVWAAEPEADAGSALLTAQRYVRSIERWAEPRYWAGWQVWGNVRRHESGSGGS